MSKPQSVFGLTYLTNFLCLFGLAVAIYAFVVETSLAMDPSYTPSCDISELISCSRALNSKFGTGFGIVGDLLGVDHWLNQKNCVYGIVVYVVLFFLSMSSFTPVVMAMQLTLMMMNLLTVYLVYVLVHLRTVCIVCIASYTINFALLCVNQRRLRAVRELAVKKRN